jgi:protoporphyrinogen/coproporphyrinogen III oxidase
MPANKVVVIGAGCAGLSAAYTLRKQGVDVAVYEASGYAGGRCRTEVEDGYEFYIGAGSTEPQWATTFQYLKELGLEDRVYSVQKQRYGFYRNGKIRTIFMGGNFMDTIRTLPENIRFLFTGIPIRAYFQILKVFSALNKYMKQVDTKSHNFEALAEISNMSTEEFVLKHGGPLALKWFFHPFLSLMVLARPMDISIAHPISLFSLMKGMRSMTGGMGVITAALYEKVKDSVKLNTPVKKVVIKNGKVAGVETKDGFVEADQVICAVDAVLARQLIPDLPETMRKPLETCNYSSTYYYQFGLEKPIVEPKESPMYVITTPPDEDTIIDFLSLGSNSKEKPVVIIPTRGWEDEKLLKLNPEERRRKVINEIRRFVPEFPDEPKITKVYRWDRAVNTEAPGQFVAIQDLLRSHMNDLPGLYLAGEYLFLIACTEGAMATGKTAAERVVDDLRNERL